MQLRLHENDLKLGQCLDGGGGRVAGLKEKTALLHEGLRALIQREAATRLAALGGRDAKAAAEIDRPEVKVLVDTSIWIDHFHGSDPPLQAGLQAGRSGPTP